MRIVQLSIAILLLLVTSFGQNQNAADEIAKLNQEISGFSKLRQFGKAIESAKKLVAVTETVRGPKHADHAEALVTLGFLYFATDSPAESANQLKRAVQVFEVLSDRGKDDLFAATLEVLAKIDRDAQRYNESIEWLNRLVDIRIRSTGADSVKTSDAKWSLANTLYSVQKFEKAFPLYRDVFNSTLRRFGELPSELIDSYTRCTCTMRKSGNIDDAISFESEFGRLVGEFDDLKGRALKLPFPEYPTVGAELKRERQVKVRIVVDEKGNVIFACANSGGYDFGFPNAAERAAYRAKFEPLRVGNVLMKFVGTITYNFRRR